VQERAPALSSKTEELLSADLWWCMMTVGEDLERVEKGKQSTVWMCRYSLLFSSGLAPALGWEMEQSCQS
jgi:hypothetical protein